MRPSGHRTDRRELTPHCQEIDVAMSVSAFRKSGRVHVPLTGERFGLRMDLRNFCLVFRPIIPGGFRPAVFFYVISTSISVTFEERFATSCALAPIRLTLASSPARCSARR